VHNSTGIRPKPEPSICISSNKKAGVVWVAGDLVWWSSITGAYGDACTV
jgi:hypothetical protein